MRLSISPAVSRSVAVPAVSWLARSWRVEVVHPERWHALAGRAAVIMSWHEALLPVLWQHRAQNVAAVVSEADDGQHLAQFAGRIGYRIIAGSSSRGGTRALLRAVRALQDGHTVGFTPDGPRGPRRVLKPGVVVAAQRGRAVIIPVHASARPAWRARSWDGLLVPPPFARVRIAYGTPFEVAPGAPGRTEGEARARQALDEVTRLSAWPDVAATATG
jgi:lysophospholipid acyltransferase (LPLAT)-like uncharacterized protein